MESIRDNDYKAMDYYPFGVVMQGRNFLSTSYPLGYQGSMKDDELKGVDNSYTTEFRELDPRIGRWSSLDPDQMKTPWESPYMSMSGNPIDKNDLHGDHVAADKSFSDNKYLTKA